MEPNFWAFMVGGGFTALFGVIIQWFRLRHDKKDSKISHSETTVNMALSTLTAVHTQYQEVLNRTDGLEKEVNDLKIQFQAQKSLVAKLKDYILYIFDNWDSVRQDPDPPKLQTDIQNQIFKEEE